MNIYKNLFINLRVLYRVFFVFVNPLSFAFYFIFPKERKILKLRSPIGKINLVLRNRQSARTIYSIFVREDYLTDYSNRNILDFGSNIGISAVYFLSRNKRNKIVCFEPDPNNAYFLDKNLEKFKDRSEIYFCAIGTKDEEEIEYNLSIDGKYSSFNKIPISKLDKKVKVKVISFDNALKKTNFNNQFPLLLKIDIEGLEKKLLQTIDFSRNSQIKELIVEGLGNKYFINKNTKPKVVNYYVEKFEF